jgi:cbb3-type cytochrome oxidase subunit 3
MDSLMAGMFGAIGTVAFFGFCAFAVWIDYRKKKEERDSAHRERMKALELGYTPLDAEIERAKAYASAAWAAGVIGLVVPIVVVSLTGAGTIVAVVFRESGENIAGPLVVSWSIAAVIMLFAILRSLSVIRQLPRPTGDAQPRGPTRDRRPDSSSSEYQEKRLGL